MLTLKCPRADGARSRGQPDAGDRILVPTYLGTIGNQIVELQPLASPPAHSSSQLHWYCGR